MKKTKWKKRNEKNEMKWKKNEMKEKNGMKCAIQNNYSYVNKWNIFHRVN